MKSRINVACLTLLTALACGEVKGPEYAGPELGRIDGFISAGTPVDGAFRLAIVWSLYTTEVDERWGAFSVPAGIQTEGVDYPPNAVTYSLPLFNPPPEKALIQTGDGSIAYGWLVAYQDLNGNGQLDTIPAGERPTDRVIGSSVGSPAGVRSHQVVYSDRARVLGSASLHRGFNILRLGRGESGWTRVDSLPLVLIGGTAGNGLVCEDPSSLSCFCGSDSDLIARGWIDSQPFHQANMSLFSCSGANPAAASVTLNGAPLTFDATRQQFILDTPAFLSAFRDGTNHVSASLAGHTPLELDAKVGPRSFLSPAAGSTHVAGTPMEVRWQQEEDQGVLFTLRYSDNPDGYHSLPVDYGDSFTLPAEKMVPGEATLGAWFLWSFPSLNGSVVNTSSLVSVRFDVQAP